MNKIVITVSLILAIAVGLGGCITESPPPAPALPEEGAPATFTISDLVISPTELKPDYYMVISVVVTNDADLAGYYKVIFKINSEVIKIKGVTLDGGVSQKVELLLKPNYAAGTYSVNVNGLLGTFTVMPEPMTLNQFLADNFGTCETSLGPTSFEFDIWENDSILFPYDYRILVEYDLGFFYDLKYSIGVTTEMNRIVCGELKAHQEKLARAVIALMPDKKFEGCYFYSWYRYPTLKVDLITYYYYSWVNYTPITVLARYNDTTVSSFQWGSRIVIDDDLTR